MEESKAVFGLYESRPAVEVGVDQLKLHGFQNTDISILLPEEGGSEMFAHANSTKAPEGASAGAGTGFIVGGALGWLIGIGALAIPGLGPFIAAGPIVALLAGAGTGAAVGGLTGALVGMGIPEYEANRYEGIIRVGGILLSVHTANPEFVKKAKSILEKTGAKDISCTTEATLRHPFKISDNTNNLPIRH